MPPLPEFVLHEYQPSAPIVLSAEQRAILQRLTNGSVAIAPSAIEEGAYVLTPGSSIGAFTIGDLDFVIRPKLPIANVLYLISYAMHRGRWADRDFGFAREPSLVEAVVPGFSRQVGRATRLGLLHGYRTTEETLSTIRGRLRFEDQVRQRFGRFPPAEVRFDEFTDDIDENRMLRSATSRLSRLHLRSHEAVRAVRTASATLSSIPVVEYDPKRLPNIGYTRLNEHYRPAVELAKLILRAASFEHLHGKVQASAFLIDMNQVFEDFVVTALREELGLSPSAFPQQVRNRLFLDTGRNVEVVPDLSWWEGDICVFVGDAKYKKVNVIGVDHANLYQLLAYTIAAHVPAGMLIYAAGEGDPAIHEVVHAGKRIIVTTLILDQSPELIRAQVRDLAVRIKHLRDGNPGVLIDTAKA